MKRNIAIVAGGDTSEIVVSLRSAQGIYSFIDKEKYNLYIVEMEGRRWEVQLPDGSKTPVDRNDFSFMNGAEKVVFDFAYITIHGTPGEDGRLQGYFDMMRIPYSYVAYWPLPSLTINLSATSISKHLVCVSPNRCCYVRDRLSPMKMWWKKLACLALSNPIWEDPALVWLR